MGDLRAPLGWKVGTVVLCVLVAEILGRLGGIITAGSVGDWYVALTLRSFRKLHHPAGIEMSRSEY